MNKKKIKELIPLAVITLALLSTAATTATTDIVFSGRHWLALSLTGIALATYFFMPQISNIVLGLTLILGTFNLLSFTPFFVTVGGGVSIDALGGGITIAFQLFSFVVLLIFFYVHWRAIMGWFNKDGI